MNDIRIGKDFNVQWAIHKVVDGQRLPYDLVGKELQLYIVNDNGRKEVAGWKVQGNVIEWTYLGKDQKRLGAYQLILVENAGKEGMVTVDTCKAFNLVEHSCDENVDGSSDIVIKTVTLESEVALAPVVKEVGGGASEEGIQEIKNDIADLQQKDVQTDAKLTELSAEVETLTEAQQFTDVAIKDLQDMKIDKEADDYYPQLSVGVADNLAGVDEVDSEFNFRQSGGGAITDGVARVQSIKGNSVVWNQLYPTNWEKIAEGVTSTSSNGIIRAAGSLSETYFRFEPFVANASNHNYLFMISGGSSTLNGAIFGLLNRAGEGQVVISNGSAYSFYTNTSPSSQKNIGIKGLTKGAAINESNIVINQYDLTKMFGAGNEPTTIEEFYSRIPMGVDLNAYNEGEVINMKATGIKSVGRNAWDEEWELGYFDANTGEPAVSFSMIRSKNYIKVIPNADYYAHNPRTTSMTFYWYDNEFKFIGTSAGVQKVIKSPTNATYLRFRCGTDYGTTYKNDICINISNADINGKYFPHIEATEDLSLVAKYFPQGMRSAGTAHDEIRYNKATNRWDATTRLKAMRVKDGAWKRVVVDSANGRYAFQITLDDISAALSTSAYTNGVLIARYGKDTTGGTSTMNDKSMRRYSKSVYIRDDAYTDVASFLASFNDNDIFYYELAEPIVTEIEEKDFNLDYKVWNCGTEQAIAEGKSSALAADITYGFNAVGLIKQLRTLVEAMQAKLANL